MPAAQYNSPISIRMSGEFIAYAAILVFMSAVWVETDSYRYVALVTILPVTIYYFYADFLDKNKILIGYAGFLCLFWGIYVAARLGYSYFFHPKLGVGSSEGIYLFPAVYPISGYALFLFVRRPQIPVSAFVLISFVVVLFSVDFPAIAEGVRAHAVLHKNPIHAAAAQGMIVLCMFPFVGYLQRANEMRPELRLGFMVIALVTVFVALANIYALESKGVWLALAVALPFQLLMMAKMHSARRGLVISVGFSLLAVAVFVLVAWNGIWAVAGDTAHAVARLLSNIFRNAEMLRDMEHAIRDNTVPESFRERLMLWASAILIWAENPIFGQGVAWLHEWQMRAYPGAEYNLMHNGYLEIAIRYGVAGLLFYAVLFSWSIRQVLKAKREGIIDAAALEAYVSVFLFFCITILTNSNVRLAIGESYMWFSGAFGFYCYYRLQRKGAVKVTTWM